MGGEPATAAELVQVTKAYRQIVALDDATLAVPSGATYLLLGPNGSGKTTLLRLLAGVLRPTKGRVRVLDLNPYRHPDRLARDLGIAYEHHALPAWSSAHRFLAFAARMQGQDGGDVEAAASAFNLHPFWDRTMGTYSAGMRKRVALAQAWLGSPPLLLLDEPFSDLDAEGRRILAQGVAARGAEGKTTVLATHLAEEAVSPSHLAILKSGRVDATGSLKDLADRHSATTFSIVVSSPPEAARLLHEAGETYVAVGGDRVLVRGNAEAGEHARRVLEKGGIAIQEVREDFDIPAIYRTVMEYEDVALANAQMTGSS